MATSDERRKVAEDLRDLRDDCYHIRYAEQFYDELREIVALDLDGTFEGVANSLAGLIDPTCEYVPIGEERFGCSECGNTVRLDYDVPVTDETPMPFKHCPNCGARVVRDED